MAPLLAALRWIDQNLEKWIILAAYMTMGGIIFVEVIRRFVFSLQAPWSTSVPVYLFLWVTWLGCAYNVKIRTHLSFDELRLRMPYNAQFLCLILDAFCWIVFSLIVVYFTIEQVQVVHMNFAIVQGTDDIMQWWFYIITPVAWALIIYRSLENLWQDYQQFRRKEPFQIVHSILGD